MDISDVWSALRDAQREIADLKSENERLRALVPGIDAPSQASASAVAEYEAVAGLDTGEPVIRAQNE